MEGLAKWVRVGRQELDWDLRKVAVRALSSALPQHGFNRLRTHLLDSAGVCIGRGAAIGGPLRITGPGEVSTLLSIGPGAFISGPLHVDLGAPVRIGARVYIGDDVKLLTGTHEMGGSEQRCDRLRWARIEIGDGTWIGSRVTIMPGVTIGRGAVVGAGALVTADVASDTLVAGVPARFIRNLNAGEVATPVPPSGTRAGRRGDAPRLRVAEDETDWKRESDDEAHAAFGSDRAWVPSSL
jgi:acetyltransferase-like isoleucine patch superfamily enzyme